MNIGLLKCAFGYHRFGDVLHDDLLDRWIKICKNCGAMMSVPAPRDDEGALIDPHTWLRQDDDRRTTELCDRLESIVED